MSHKSNKNNKNNKQSYQSMNPISNMDDCHSSMNNCDSHCETDCNSCVDSQYTKAKKQTNKKRKNNTTDCR